jgi:arginyl-tRNA synthetase
LENINLTIQKTNKDFQGDFTLVVFPITKYSKKSPETTANELGNYISSHTKIIKEYNVIKGFLNFLINDNYWLDFLSEAYNTNDYGKNQNKEKKETIIVEYSSPNTNKPLHLGHIRNNLLGYSISQILKALGYDVKMVNLINDRGIHICKSMLAWLKWGNGETPETSGIKGDHLVGKYYVLFNNKLKEEIDSLIKNNTSIENIEKNAPLLIEAQEMLKKWEEGDKNIRNLWQKMNNWVYNGFDITYNELGIYFDKIYYESETYLFGKEIVNEGLQKGIFIRKNDGSVWVDLTDEGLDEKLLLRADGTSVYITQDIGTAQTRYDEFHPDKMIYVVGNEQDYHFNVLKTILYKKLNIAWAKNIYHLSYGMVELPNGKMKSREGTVVDADDLIQEMILIAQKTSQELGKTNNLPYEEAQKLYKIIGVGALKYFILKVDPKKKILFNPEESIELNGNTAPFIQYTFARIQSLLSKAIEKKYNWGKTNYTGKINNEEKNILKIIHDFPLVILEAGNTFNPALIANYVYELVKTYNHFYQEIPILKENNSDMINFRLQLSELTAKVIYSSMQLLSIELPYRM